MFSKSLAVIDISEWTAGYTAAHPIMKHLLMNRSGAGFFLGELHPQECGQESQS